jgi:hypothetical protein
VKVAGGYDDDRDSGEVRVRSEPVQHDEAVTGGQTEVQNNQIRQMLASPAYRGQCVGGKNGIVVVGLEKDVIPEAHIGIVLDDKNLLDTHDEIASERM